MLGKHLAGETGSFFKLCNSYETFVELIVFLVKCYIWLVHPTDDIEVIKDCFAVAVAAEVKSFP